MNLVGCLLLTLAGLDGPSDGVSLPDLPPGGLREASVHRHQPAGDALLPQAAASPMASQTAWRRTRDGWELSSEWTLHRISRPPALHPVVVGLLEVFLALIALIAFSGKENRPAPLGPGYASRPDPPRR